jgi:hypothetical protein
MFVAQDDAECFKARTAIGARILDQPFELERSFQRCRIVEENAPPHSHDVRFMLRGHPRLARPARPASGSGA